MNRFQRGEIWLVNFDPSVGHEYKKVRPALIVLNNSYIKSGSLLTVIPISSQTTKHKQLDIFLEKDLHNRLMSDSLLKMKQISSFDKQRFIKLIGSINETVMKYVEKNISSLLLP